MRNFVAQNTTTPSNGMEADNIPNLYYPFQQNSSGDILNSKLEDKIDSIVERLKFIMNSDSEFKITFNRILSDFNSGGLEYKKVLKEMLTSKKISFAGFSEDDCHYILNYVLVTFLIDSDLGEYILEG